MGDFITISTNSQHIFCWLVPVEIRTKFECRKNMSNPLSRTKYLIKYIRGGYDDGIML